MAILVNRLTDNFAAEIRGVDLSQKIPSGDFADVKTAFEQHSILVFPDQPLTDQQQIIFSERFGELEKTINTKQ